MAHRSYLAVIAAGVIAVLGTPAIQDPKPTHEERLTKLEAAQAEVVRRIEGVEKLLEPLRHAQGIRNSGPQEHGRPAAEGPAFALPATSLAIRLDTGQQPKYDYDDRVELNATFDLAPLGKSARALKGKFVFRDLFGEIRASFTYTMNALPEGGTVARVTNVGVDYNQFSDEQRWLLATRETDMKLTFEVDEVIWR